MPVDEDYDSQIIFMKQGEFTVYTVSKLGDAVGEAIVAYQKANSGRSPATADELIPYIATPVDSTKLREYWTVKDR